MGIAEKFDIDLDDVESYPESVFEYYLEKKQYDAHIKRKDDDIKKVEDRFHQKIEARAIQVARKRKERGLKVKGERADQIKVEP